MAILPVSAQISAWLEANHKMQWGISAAEFDGIGAPLEIGSEDHRAGFMGVILSYGFGDDGKGNADCVLSGKLAWEYACACRKKKAWKTPMVAFDAKRRVRLRLEAPPRPQGFYFAKFKPGDPLRYLKIFQFLERLSGDTGLAPEGIQMMAVTHPFFADLMNERRIAFMALADYEIAAQTEGDFSQVLQLFCSDGVLGLGIGHINRSQPLFGAPTLRF